MNSRQPIPDTVYGGAHLFRKDVCGKLGAIAERAMTEYAPDAATMARVMGFSEALARDGLFAGEWKKAAGAGREFSYRLFEDGRLGSSGCGGGCGVAVAGAGGRWRRAGGGELRRGVLRDSGRSRLMRGVEGAGASDSADFSGGRWQVAGEVCGGVAEDYGGRAGRRAGGGFGGFSWRRNGVDG